MLETAWNLTTGMVLTKVDTSEEHRWDAAMDGVVGWYLSATMRTKCYAAMTKSYCQYH